MKKHLFFLLLAIGMTILVSPPPTSPSGEAQLPILIGQAYQASTEEDGQYASLIDKSNCPSPSGEVGGGLRFPDRQAVIGESPAVPNVVSTRTQRILLSQSPHNNRQVRCGMTATYHHRKTLSNSFDSRRGRLAAPFQSCVSSTYFVIALRHIVR